MNRMFLFVVALAISGHATALDLSQMQMKKYDDRTKVTCSYRMPEIEHAAPLFFDFEMRATADSSAPAFFNFVVAPEENRYVEFAPNGTKIILRKTTKGIWKIAMVRNFEAPDGHVVCTGRIRVGERYWSEELSDFKRLDGYFDEQKFYFETTRTEYGESGYCWINGVDCFDNYAEFTYTYRHEEPLRTLPGRDWDDCYSECEWGYGDSVYTEGVQNLVALEAKITVEGVGVFEFTVDEATEFNTWEVLDYSEPRDATDYADKVIRAVDSENGYWMTIDSCDPDFTSCITVDLDGGDYVSIGTRLKYRDTNSGSN